MMAAMEKTIDDTGGGKRVTMMGASLLDLF